MNYDKLFALAKEKGIEDIQVYFVDDGQFDIEVFNGSLEKYSIADTQKLTVKGIYNGKMGTVSTEVISDDMLDFVVDSIIDSAKQIDAEDEVFIYEGDKEYKHVEGLYNPELDEVTAKDKIDKVLELEKKVKEADKRITMCQAFYGEGKSNILLQNSKGLKLEKEVNNAALGVYAVASDGKDNRTVYEYVLSNEYADFDVDTIAQEAAEKATAMLGATACDSGEYEILLKNTASASLLFPHVSMFNAESVQKNVSLLKDKVGEAIASDLVTLVDDPFRKKSAKSGAFDDEGVATKYKEVIENGKLTGYLHNLKTAKKDNVAPTGNGFGGATRPTNFYIKPGETKYEDAVKSMKKGLIITDLQGTHSGTDPISGAFSLQAAGFLVENGEIVRPVALITVAGNYLELLKDVTEVCDDLKLNFAYIGSPSIKIKKLVVSGN